MSLGHGSLSLAPILLRRHIVLSSSNGLCHKLRFCIRHKRFIEIEFGRVGLVLNDSNTEVSTNVENCDIRGGSDVVLAVHVELEIVLGEDHEIPVVEA